MAMNDRVQFKILTKLRR